MYRGNNMRIRRLVLGLPDDGGEGGDGGKSGDGAGTGGGAGGSDGGKGGDGGKSGEAGDGGKDGGEAGKSGSDDEFKSLEGKRQTLADLRAERDKRQAAEQALQKELDKQKTQEQRDQEARETRDAEAQKAIRVAAQYEAAEKAELPLKWAKRISGTTPEEMLADAQDIAASLKKDDDGEHTHGAGGAGSGDAAESSDGMETLTRHFASTAGKSRKK